MKVITIEEKINMISLQEEITEAEEEEDISNSRIKRRTMESLKRIRMSICKKS